MANVANDTAGDLPPGLGKPATRALAAAGYVRLEQFTHVSEAEVLKLHGVGPRALDQIRRALAAMGLAFGEERGSAASASENRHLIGQLVWLLWPCPLFIV